jgi:hypothetical protein
VVFEKLADWKKDKSRNSLGVQSHIHVKFAREKVNVAITEHRKSTAHNLDVFCTDLLVCDREIRRGKPCRIVGNTRQNRADAKKLLT